MKIATAFKPWTNSEKFGFSQISDIGLNTCFDHLSHKPCHIVIFPGFQGVENNDLGRLFEPKRRKHIFSGMSQFWLKPIGFNFIHGLSEWIPLGKAVAIYTKQVTFLYLVEYIRKGL